MKGLILKTITVLLMLAVILPAQAVDDLRVTYVHTDADGTPFAATDEEGNLEWSIEHMPFGAEHSNTEVRRNNNLSFVGRMYDEEIGLSYFGGRWYDPHAGRFTGIDPMPVNAEDWRTFNRYAYGNNNPYKYVDPDGNLPILIPLVMFLAKEGVAEVASRYTNGATDFLSVRRMGSKAVKKSISILRQNKGNTVSNDGLTNAVASKPNTSKPKLKRIHSDETLNSGSNKFDLESQRTRSTDDIIDSLKPNSAEPLKVKSDGRVFDGNTRVKVLEERGVDVNSLPRTVIDD